MSLLARSGARLRRLCLVTTLSVAAAFPTLIAAQVVRTEVLPLQSVTLTDEQFLGGHEPGKPVTVAGVLSLPRAGSDRLPAIVILHPSGGINSGITDWQQEFLAMGVATFVVESFAGRGVVNTLNDQGQLGRLVQLEDAYRALDLLQKHPRIDPERVILMGESRGGQPALYADLKRFQRLHGSSSGKGFAGYIAFYPNCNTTFRADDDFDDKPVLVFMAVQMNLLLSHHAAHTSKDCEPREKTSNSSSTRGPSICSTGKPRRSPSFSPRRRP